MITESSPQGGEEQNPAYRPTRPSDLLVPQGWGASPPNLCWAWTQAVPVSSVAHNQIVGHGMGTTVMSETIVARGWKRTGAIASTVALGMGLLAFGNNAAQAASAPRVNDCGSLETRPAELVLACADANELIQNIRWKSWKKKRAVGTGTYRINDCDPTCAAGEFDSYRVRIVLRTPKNQSGERVYSRAVLRFPNGGPDGEKRQGVRFLRYQPAAADTTPTPVATPTPTATATPEASPSASPSATPSPSATVTPSPSPTPTAEAGVQEQQETITLAVVNQSKISGRLRFTIEAESTLGGNQRGIESVEVIRRNEYNAQNSYDARWAGPYRPSTWTVLTGCSSKNKSKTTIIATSESGLTKSIDVDARTGC